MCRDDETGLWVARSFGSVRVKLSCLVIYLPSLIPEFPRTVNPIADPR